jgi:hypothetical protein
MLCTHSFSASDIQQLVIVLTINFYLNCRVRELKPGQYGIYISAKSIPTLQKIVAPYMTPSMLYKIYL